jgi:hypothetical protein
MYNYYTHIKNKNEQNKIAKLHNQEENIKMKRKNDINTLISGYESRLKNFIYNMVSDPICVKDSLVNFETSRKQLYDEELHKIKGRHGIILKGFKTEKQRIEDYLNERKYGYISNKKKKEFVKILTSTKTDRSVISPKEKSNILIQPSMRFKPRSDLERIYDTNNDYYNGRVDRKMIEKHLDAMGLYTSRRIKKNVDLTNEDNSLHSPNEDYSFQIKKDKQMEMDKIKKRREVIIKERNETKQLRENRYRLDQINLKHLMIDSKNIMGDLHHKTFFKGAANYSVSPKAYKLSRNIKVKPIDNIQDYIDYEDTNKKSFCWEDNSKYRLSKLNVNPLKHKTIEEVDPEKFAKLKELAFSKDEFTIMTTLKNNRFPFIDKIKESNMAIKSLFLGEASLQSDRISYLNKYADNPELVSRKPDDDRIIVGDVELNRNDIGGISKLVLANCNYFHKKNKNNNSTLKSRNGKLMHTNGLSVYEFINKYNLTTSSIK